MKTGFAMPKKILNSKAEHNGPQCFHRKQIILDLEKKCNGSNNLQYSLLQFITRPHFILFYKPNMVARNDGV